MPNKEQVERLLAGVEGWNKWRRKIHIQKLSLDSMTHCCESQGANLRGANLKGAYFEEAHLKALILRKPILLG